MNKQTKLKWYQTKENLTIMIFVVLALMFVVELVSYESGYQKGKRETITPYAIQQQEMTQTIILIAVCTIGLAFMIHGVTPLKLIDINITHKHYKNKKKEK